MDLKIITNERNQREKRTYCKIPFRLACKRLKANRKPGGNFLWRRRRVGREAVDYKRTQGNSGEGAMDMFIIVIVVVVSEVYVCQITCFNHVRFVIFPF